MASLRELYNPTTHHFKMTKVSYDHELIYAWGSNLSVQNAEDVMRLLLMVEKEGWDAMSMGVTLAWAIDAFQSGVIGPKETDGFVLTFGDAGLYGKILERIAKGHNEFYRDLEQGAAFCSRKYGGAGAAIAFGGNEAPGYMTGLYSFLGYATGVRHSHLDSAGYSIDQKYLGKPADDEEMTKALLKESIWRMALNSLVICLFARNIYTKEIVLEGLDALGIAGWDEARLQKTARRIHAMKIAYKEACGFRWEDLSLPQKLGKVNTSAGLVSPERFTRQVARYRQLAEEDKAALDTPTTTV
jgi:aldehyde:ferredoxin oxidoreductase